MQALDLVDKFTRNCKRHFADDLLDERPDGVYLSYGSRTCYLTRYENVEALEVARELDAKIQTLLPISARENV